MSLQSLKERLTGAAREVEREGREVGHDAAAGVRKGAEEVRHFADEVRDKAHDAKRKFAEANDSFQAPFFPNIGSNYDVTFAQPDLSTKQVSLSTPNLWPALSSSGLGLLRLTAVHDLGAGGSTAAGGAPADQLTATLHWGDVFGPAVKHTPAIKDAKGNRVRVGFEWKRPIEWNMAHYLAVPMYGAVARHTLKIANEIVDVNTGYSLNIASRLDGAQWVHSAQTRGKYGTMMLAYRNDPKRNTLRQVVGELGSTLYRDSLLNKSLTARVQVTSARFSRGEGGSSYPTQVGSLVAKAEWDEPRYTLDTTLRASNFAAAGAGHAFKLSEAYVRALMVRGVGPYPRYCFGATLGLVSSGAGGLAEEESGVASAAGEWRPHTDDPDLRPSARLADALGGALNAPVAEAACSVHLSQRAKVKMAVGPRVALASFQYRLAPNVSVATSLRTRVGGAGDWRAIMDPKSFNAASTLGFALNISTD